ncbi:replication initiation protein RepC [Terripilifer ovatus]|uniref:replication initiation protein RepC n=1 Tax=Terripilifer ovatus TaxID=3032367 RepID=UPI003AB92516
MLHRIWVSALSTRPRLETIRPCSGSAPALEEAQTVLGEMTAAVVVACILQRGAAIRSAGAYLRGLTRKAEAGEFSLGPISMSQINSRLNEKRRA